MKLPMFTNLVTAVRAMINTLRTRINRDAQRKLDLKGLSGNTGMLDALRKSVSVPNFTIVIFIKIPRVNTTRIIYNGAESIVREIAEAHLREMEVLPSQQYLIDMLIGWAQNGDGYCTTGYPGEQVHIFIGEEVGRYLNDDTRSSPDKLYNAIFRNGD